MKKTILTLLIAAIVIPDFVAPTINKTIVVTPHDTYTVSSGGGIGGTDYVYEQRQPNVHEQRQPKVDRGRFSN